MQVSTILVSIGTMGILGGFAIIIGDKSNTIIGCILGFLGLIVTIYSYIRVQQELMKESNTRERLFRTLGSINTNISDLTTEIRNDRIERRGK